ncbi:MAG: hypothetical protein LWW99_01665 [Deltaproteobacteria bacterium]|nr:hypothetical protein [Deltaproteobacteria bacterium]
MEKASGEQFEDIKACLRATHRQAWQLARELACKVYGLTKKADERKVTLNL